MTASIPMALRQDSRTHLLDRLARSLQTPAGQRFLHSVSQIPIPAYAYFRGFFSLASHDYWGHSAFLLDRVSTMGWWYYFPVAIGVKMTIATIAGLLLWISISVRRWRLRWAHLRALPFDAWLLGLPPVAYFLWSLTSHIDIGVRHIFPVWPFIFLAIASTVSLWQATWKRILFVLAMVGWTVAISLMAWPHTFAYFNAFAGGTTNGVNILLDSNYDWNQDIWRLKTYLDEHHFSEVHIALFGSIPVGRVFPSALPVLWSRDITSGRTPSGIVVISAGALYDRHGPYAWLRSRTPLTRVGSSIFVYDFR